jgi:hypothetical protein
MKKRWFSVLALLLCVGLGLSAQAWSKDEAEIRGLIEKFSLMWTADNGLEIFDGISSAGNFLHVTPQGGERKSCFHSVLCKRESQQLHCETYPPGT